MKVAVVGGGLQGIEATYLAHECGWEVLLIDKNSLAPATGLCDEFFLLDVTLEEEKLLKVFEKADLVIPALENDKALKIIKNIKSKVSAPIAFDFEAYEISSSKQKSNTLFESLGVPMPKLWPNCNIPVIIKPVNASGSQGVEKITTVEKLAAFTTQKNFSANNWVIQDFVEGPSYSLEIFGCLGQYFVIQVTDLEMDSNYDCKRIIAPTILNESKQKDFEEIAFKIAQEINLTGIMDVEVIHHQGEFRVLEIDARIPSQTPTAVLKSTGINMLELLAQIYLDNEKPDICLQISGRGVIYEHIKISENIMQVAGEHILTTSGPIYFCSNFFGADEAITNFQHQKSEWVATLIIVAENLNKVWQKREQVIQNIKTYCGITAYQDLLPEGEE
ncbi:MAG: 3-methylornithine--L-lysine ligase PylC [Clostridia bacterium]|nr:3-methylornithine--L-lysine ligase PylC [Clostridia bacterium]